MFYTDNFIFSLRKKKVNFREPRRKSMKFDNVVTELLKA